MVFKSCVDACDDAHRLCTETAIHAMQQGGAAWETIQLLLDTADIAETAADFMLRSSRQHHLVCGVAAEITDKCANVCEAMAADDLRMRECSEACRRAATLCRKLL
jgi:hypothetical protein